MGDSVVSAAGLCFKRRWLRKFATDGHVPVEIARDANEKPVTGSPPARGCNVELTEVRIGSLWWTLGFESFGSIHTVEADLRAVARSSPGSAVPLRSKAGVGPATRAG
jgi:hypothetical protein